MTNTAKKPNPNDVIVGQNIKNRRNQLGMSQEKLGDALGVTFQQVQKYEKGTNRTSASKLVAISNVLQTTVEALFAGTGMKDAPEQKILSPQAYKLASQFDQIKNPKLQSAVSQMVREAPKKPEDAQSADIVQLKTA